MSGNTTIWGLTDNYKTKMCGSVCAREQLSLAVSTGTLTAYTSFCENSFIRYTNKKQLIIFMFIIKFYS